MPVLHLQIERQKKELTQTELADVMRSKKQTISDWENGVSTPSYNTLKQLSAFFGKDIDYLLSPIDKTELA